MQRTSSVVVQRIKPNEIAAMPVDCIIKETADHVFESLDPLRRMRTFSILIKPHVKLNRR